MKAEGRLFKIRLYGRDLKGTTPFKTGKHFMSLKVEILKQPNYTDRIEVGGSSPYPSDALLWFKSGNGMVRTVVYNVPRPINLFFVTLHPDQEVIISGYDQPNRTWKQPEMKAEFSDMSAEDYEKLNVPEHLR